MIERQQQTNSKTEQKRKQIREKENGSQEFTRQQALPHNSSRSKPYLKIVTSSIPVPISDRNNTNRYGSS
jgi:hypothetical protein